MASTASNTTAWANCSVPADALYGAQTQRAVQNFPISGLRMPREFIRALGLVKAAAARGQRRRSGLLPAGHGRRRSRTAARAVAEGEHDAQFPIDVFQTGSGTSSNMNANEVIATLAIARAGKAGASQRPRQPGPELQRRHPDRDPGRRRRWPWHEQLLPALEHLRATIDRRAQRAGAAWSRPAART